MRNNRLGYLLIFSSLTAIAILIGLSVMRHHETRVEQIRVQGMGVVRSLTALPYEMLAPQEQGTSVLQSLFTFYKPDDFAYGAISTPEGHLLREVVRPGVITPDTVPPISATAPFGERTLVSPQTNRTIREFYGQINTSGQEAAFVRVGYFEPRIAFAGQELSYFAMLALPTFLLVPLIYFMLAREMRPLRQACQQLEATVVEKSGLLSADPAQFDLQRVANRIYSYVQESNSRMADLEQEKIGLVTRNRLLEYGNNKLNFVLQSLPHGLLVLDPAGHITFASGKVGAMLGVELAVILEERIDGWCADEVFRNLLLRYQTSNAQSMRSETLEFHPQHSPDKYLRVTAQPLVVAAEGPAFGTLVVLQDATREHVSQSASQDFVAHVSHELKSPLNVIAMYCEMLQGEGAGDAAVRVEATNVIHDEVERMASLVNNLLNISKIEVGGFTPRCTRVRLDELLQDIYQSLLPRAQASQITMELEVAHELAPASVDKDMLRIAINNLMTNALKYNQGGGKVVLRAKEDDHGLVISVQDTGIGIPSDQQAHVFKKFFRAAGDGERRAGHGLGLYLAHEIVQLHHGRLQLDSTPGKGSTFSIHLQHATRNEFQLT